MSEVAITITADCGGYNIPSTLMDKAKLAAQHVIDDAIRAAEFDSDVKCMLQDDEAFEAFCLNCTPLRGGFVPCVRASTYGANYQVPYWQEVLRPFEYGYRNPRRPVYMRGSLGVMTAKYADHDIRCQNGFVREIVRRYLRKKKITCLTASEWSPLPGEPKTDVFRLCGLIQKAVYSKDWYLGGKYGIFDGLDVRDPGHSFGQQCWINGKIVGGLTPQQLTHLKAMYAIIKKTDKIDKRMMLLREYRKAQHA